MNQLDHLIQIEGFIEGCYGPETPGPVVGLLIAEGGHADEGRAPTFIRLALKDIEPGQRRHAQVTDNQVEGVPFFKTIGQIATVGATGHQVAGPGQGEIEELAESVIIISEQDMWMSIESDSCHLLILH